ncbi:MAG: carbamoyl phosphate synthase large subunit [Candidatus Methanomethylicota archaeon]|uniref:Carbamoyl phosphate synthase large chain n=2 Tax=Thermoproteota archaeon TaxID=2056631 RepID=A0A497ESC3_9CREN|nr:MAG: carbamoyl phosphate synthase large subunit [Candidatus Verstraetearchaeota archaeon]
MGKVGDVRKVVILGSGAIKVGEAAEFDYSGSQAIKALKEEDIDVVLVNPNVATVQTDPNFADKVYLLPITADVVEKIIEIERPDGIMFGFGGQAALNCGFLLHKNGILKKYGVKVLGTSVEAIERASNRERFRETMIKAGIPVPPSKAASSVEEALRIANEIGYPVMMRVAYNLGGRGSGVAYNDESLREKVRKGLAQSLIHQVLIEKYLERWKEVETEVVRDYYGNSVVVAFLENMDPMGIHTGDSIVVAPAQTLTNREYHLIRDYSIRVAEAIGIVGECNVQFALDYKSETFYAIETNPRMSRSSALASKATGYPLAYIAAKLAIGYSLPELINRVTGITTAAFEPSLDYIVVKVPRWDFDKFNRADRRIGTQMKSIGEVMAIGRCFEEAIQKAIRMLDIGKNGLVCNFDKPPRRVEDVIERLKNADDRRLFNIVYAIKLGVSEETIFELTGIDPWYIRKIKNIIDMEERLKRLDVKNTKETIETIAEAKRLGFSDKQIAILLGWSEERVREFRKKYGIIPVVKKIDTLAAEWPAKVNYLYVTYGGTTDDIELEEGKRKIAVLGSSGFRIGVSVEFDWATVSAIKALKKRGFEAIVINCNPETVSTDWDVADKLYFEEITVERVLDIYEKERLMGVFTSFGGQTPNNIAFKLEKNGVRILGTLGKYVDQAEDRNKFSALTDKLGIKQPVWMSATSVDAVVDFAKKHGYPVIVRPSYVIGGSAMKICKNEEELVKHLTLAAVVTPEYPVVVSKFIENAIEVEVDAVSDGEKVLIGAIIEHVEAAGVHSGDATMVIPPRRLNKQIIQKLVDVTVKLCRMLHVKGPVNIQYMVDPLGEVYVIEANLRASRSMPYVSKATGVNLIDRAVEAMLEGLRMEESVKILEPVGIAVKVPQFSWMQLTGAEPILDANMRSTGEVAALGRELYEAFLKAWLAAQPNKIPEKAALIYAQNVNEDLEACISELAMMMPVYSAPSNGKKLNHVNVNEVSLSEAIELVKGQKVDLVVVLSEEGVREAYRIKRAAADFNVPLILREETLRVLVDAIKWLKQGGILEVKSIKDYYEQTKVMVAAY